MAKATWHWLLANGQALWCCSMEAVCLRTWNSHAQCVLRSYFCNNIRRNRILIIVSPPPIGLSLLFRSFIVGQSRDIDQAKEDNASVITQSTVFWRSLAFPRPAVRLIQRPLAISNFLYDAISCLTPPSRWKPFLCYRRKSSPANEIKTAHIVYEALCNAAEL